MTAACSPGVDTGFVSLGYAKVAWLGLVQGVTELLPIYSTAHMRVVPALLGWRDPGAAFSAAMQLAARVAVVSYFRRDVVRLAGGSVSAIPQRRFDDADLRLTLRIGLATLPIVIAGAALSTILNQCASPLRSLTVIGWACIGMALLIALTEITARHRCTVESSSLVDAILVGLAQVGALIPGISRSGSTLTAALALIFRREEAARFSFLIGIPAIALAALKEIWELHRPGLDLRGWSVLMVGLLTASISAFIAIWALMRILERFSAWPFVVYQGLLGVLFLIMMAWSSFA